MFEINQLQFIFCTTEGFLLEGQKLRVIGTQDEENTIDNFKSWILNAMKDIQQNIKKDYPAILVTFEQMEADLKNIHGELIM